MEIVKAVGTVIDYKSSGVDVEAGDKLVDWIKAQPPTGAYKNIRGGIGGFSALFKLDLTKYKNPLLVSCTDGVGTKVKLAVELNCIEPTGIDLVAMCVNDMITCGADPLFFLDYYASGKLQLSQAQALLKGIMEGLKQSDCTLVGGETAEMPGVYAKDDYDCAGFSVGVVDEDKVIDGKNLNIGDVAIGISSSGFHSNGFSLLRKLYEKDFKEHANVLMTPTRIYVGLVKTLKEKIKIKAMAHITGGGVLGNVPRVMQEFTALKTQRWPWPDTFAEVQRRSGLSAKQMLETLNCGIGYVIFVSTQDAKTVIEESEKLGWSAWNIGSIVKHLKAEPEVLI
ncbi:MAG: phosphoribosylformylglycinamidine cyclo-ligase [Oligoflexia bacterium]|nr:phosphoribosylformylglycinamidine cyclo-ligase [Oligoflexia bacterium]